MSKTVLIITLILILLAGGVYFLITSGRIPNPLSKKTTGTSLGEQIYQQTKNPVKVKIPETNPFAVETNPIKAIYPNPFR